MEEPVANNCRDAIANLVREVAGDEIIFRTLEGRSYTAREIAENIEAGTALGHAYGSDLLRVARDLLARSARKKDCTTGDAKG